MFLDTDSTKPTQELLENLRQATSQTHYSGLPVLPMGVLMAKLAKDAGDTVDDLKVHITELNKKNGQLQVLVVILSIVTLLATLAQVYVAFNPPETASACTHSQQQSVAIPEKWQQMNFHFVQPLLR